MRNEAATIARLFCRALQPRPDALDIERGGVFCTNITAKSQSEQGIRIQILRMRRLFSQDKPQVETVTCFKVTPGLAEHSGEIWARWWVDLRVSECSSR